jgi:tetratricopeptide (TPR) repeat protein
MTIFSDKMLSRLVMLSANRYMSELLERILSADRQGQTVFTDAGAPDVGFTAEQMRHYIGTILGIAYQFSGKLRDARNLYQSALDVFEGDLEGLRIIRPSYSHVLCRLGMLAQSEQEARQALIEGRRGGDQHTDEGSPLTYLGLTLAVKGNSVQAQAALERALRLAAPVDTSTINAGLSLLYLWRQAPDVARSFADQAAQGASDSEFFPKMDIVRAIHLLGAAALELDDPESADEHLHHALTLAREANLVEGELATLITLAELRRRKGAPTGAREFLEDAWDLAERGPFVLLQADAYNVLAHIERDEGDHEAAVEAATKAYRLAWCDGPPFAYHWGLTAARRHLDELSAHEPEMPPFDPDKHGPMPEVQIELEDTH